MRIPISLINELDNDEADIIISQDEVENLVEQGRKTHASDKKIFAIDYKIDGKFASKAGESFCPQNIDLIFVRIYQDGLYSITGYYDGVLEFCSELLDY